MLLFGNCEYTMNLGDTTNIEIDKDLRYIRLTDKCTGKDEKPDMWEVLITKSGIDFTPTWVRVYYSQEILQFIGEKVTPLLCTEAPAYSMLDNSNLVISWCVGQKSYSSVMLNSLSYVADTQNSAVRLPFTGTLKDYYVPTNGTSTLKFSLNNEFVFQLNGLIGIQIPASKLNSTIEEGTLLGYIDNSLELMLFHTSDTDIYLAMNPLILLGNEGRAFLQTFDYEDKHSLLAKFNKDMEIYKRASQEI